MNQSETDLPRLGAPALRALASVGVTRLEQLTAFTESDIKKLHGMGPKSIKQLYEALEQRGISFATKK
ncbi:MAG: DNA-binding protein [Anaerolineae bacterium]|nr:DNA-binding protein [Anaerolineae bacterium]